MLKFTRNKKVFTVEDNCTLELAAGETVSFDLRSGGHWFGHGFNHTQPYPLETGSVVNAAFAVNNIQSPIWMCSAGCVIFADTTQPLDVRLNENGDGTFRLASPHAPLWLHVFHERTLPAARAALMRHLRWPNPPPEPRMFGDSIFCTWTQHPRCVTQARVLDMARQIRAHGYPCSTLIIDDRWESCFGELTFSRDFPDPRAMLRELHELGFRVWLWVTPFVNQEATGFDKLTREKILVQRRDGAGAALLKWWGGTAGLVDLTSGRGQKWYYMKLGALKALGVDGFKIDGGDFKYQPSPELAAWGNSRGASGFADVLPAFFEDIARNQCETRTAWLSQNRPVIWREGGKDSHWGLDNGLKALVTLGLHLGLMGYDILIPDMVPGRVQTMVSDLPLPTDELMVRWTEASAFFPLLQFSYFPWNYSDATARAVLGYARVHKALQDYIAEQARDRTAPLLRPIWFDTPEEESLYAVADEFMLGSDLLVAPVLDAGVTTRDVLLPPGRWKDAWSGATHDGGVVKSHPAPCPGVPLFVRAQKKDLLSRLRAALSEIRRGSVPSGVTTARYSAGLDRDLSVTG
jgi:alpha-glucosidase (family GH31 glycosyl hydrolase)